ncbi:MAG: thioredoxin family protein [Mucilaginibacter sp.]|uniref:thioredoxin family protein n=1 Tax=Mucilaginibacter sp. TaxID=1882438 RepID=UPI00319FD862
MKLLTIVLFLFASASITWLGDFSKAQIVASASHKVIMVNFSGSDWCGPCIRLRKEILESEKFKDFAAGNLVLVRADFPRQKKNQLSKDQVKLNEALAEKYNPEGKFPYTLLLDEQGKVLKEWDGYPDETPEQFINQIKPFANAVH